MNRSEGQLGIDLEIRTEVRGTVRVETAAPAAGAAEAPTATETPEFEQVPLPGADPEAPLRTSGKLAAELKPQTDYLVRQLEQRGPGWLTDREAEQWLHDLEVVRTCLREEERRLFAKGGATEDGLYAEVIERIVGKRAKPAYRGQPIPALDELFDPNGMILDELRDRIDAAADTPDPAADPETGGNLQAARADAKAARQRAKIAVARARVFDRHPEWRAELAARFT